jgi:hypothetical protein
MNTRIVTRDLEPALAMLNEAIEPGVLGLVTALNDIDGISTIASCHGHGREARFLRPAMLESTPYVLFSAPTEFSRALAAQIGLGKGSSQRLYYNWRLTAFFYPPAYENLVWGLELKDARIPSQWDRVRINTDWQPLLVLQLTLA